MKNCRKKVSAKLFFQLLIEKNSKPNIHFDRFSKICENLWLWVMKRIFDGENKPKQGQNKAFAVSNLM